MLSSFALSQKVASLQQQALELAPDAPLIGVTGNFSEGQLQLAPGYYRSLEAAGAQVVVIPPRRVPDVSLIRLLDRLDGILLSGGADLNPLYLDEEPVPALHGINAERDAFELALIPLAYQRQMPLFGICRGIQLLAAALGGTVLQDLKTALPDSPLLKHSQDAPRGVATHTVTAEADSQLVQLLGERFAVNSFHHQAVGCPGPHLRVTARSVDHVVEAVESAEGKPVMGVQWHPECFLLEGDEAMMPLFRHFVAQAKAYRKARRVHQTILTLDSHCDTPMFFDQGVQLNRRDPKLLVDFPKMREGGLDVTIMVAYLPQGERDAETSARVTARATALLNEIEQRVQAAPGVSLAATPAELYRNKECGKLSVMRGIENGYALGKNIDNVARFRKMGVVYITLCHNGDNDICDSARRSSQEHNGLSAFGREVIREMNRTGLMVDLSHAAEKSFYDALEISSTPIVCSHSSSRTLCDHPRNLTDDQLRALAQVGGVAQVTFYHGFLRPEVDGHPTATVDDAVRHLLHMIEVAGIDHVGIGTDFDGDGGLPGCANASELIGFTQRLQAEGLTTEDLRKVWGGNFLRVMTLCQQVARVN